MPMPSLRSLVVAIIATSHLGAVPAVAAPRQQVPADLVLHRGKVVTLDAHDHIASAVVIRDGVIIAVGDEAIVARYATKRMIDLRGRMLMPGFNDAHTHVSGDARRYIDLSAVRSIREL